MRPGIGFALAGAWVLSGAPLAAQTTSNDVGVVDNPCTVRAGEAPPPDFAGLCRYRAENAALRARGARVDVVFIGDSITDGWINNDPALFSSTRLDRGISGQTSAQMLLRFRQDVIDLHPRVVHILAGTNDIARNTGPTTLDAIEGNITTMAELARAHGIRVVIGAVLPASAYGWRPEIAPAETIRRLNARLRAYARAHGAIFVDYHRLLTNTAGGMDPANAADGVHPTPAAYRAMRPLALAAIARK